MAPWAEYRYNKCYSTYEVNVTFEYLNVLSVENFSFLMEKVAHIYMQSSNGLLACMFNHIIQRRVSMLRSQIESKVEYSH